MIKSLEVDGWTTSVPSKREGWKLTAEGEAYAAKGSPEVQVFEVVKAKGSATKEDLDQALGEVGKAAHALCVSVCLCHVCRACRPCLIGKGVHA